MMKPKVIFIDWYHTLSDSLFFEQLKNPSHPRHEWLHKIQKCVFVENKHLQDPWLKGEITYQEVVTIISHQIGLPSEILLEDLIESCHQQTLAHPEVLPIVQQIRKRGTKVVIATGNMDLFQKFVIPALNLKEHFDEFLNSCELGHLKQDIEGKDLPFFKPYLTKEGLTYADAVLIDDYAYPEGTLAKCGLKLRHITHSSELPAALKEVAGL